MTAPTRRFPPPPETPLGPPKMRFDETFSAEDLVLGMLVTDDVISQRIRHLIALEKYWGQTPNIRDLLKIVLIERTRLRGVLLDWRNTAGNRRDAAWWHNWLDSLDAALASDDIKFVDPK